MSMYKLARDMVIAVSVLPLTPADLLGAKCCFVGLQVPYTIFQFLILLELSFSLFLPLSSFVA